MDHEYTQNLVGRENVLHEFILNVIGGEDNKTYENCTTHQ